RTVAWRSGAVDLCRAIFVVAQREFRTRDVSYAGDSVQRHRLPSGIADKKLADVLRVCAVIAFGLNVSLPSSSEAIEIVHEKSSHERLQRLIYRGQIDSLLDDFVAVDVYKNLGHVRLERRNKSAEFRALVRSVEKGLHVLREERDV